METFSFIDIYATKGIEYLVVIVFLVTIVGFYRHVIADKDRRHHGHK